MKSEYARFQNIVGGMLFGGCLLVSGCSTSSSNLKDFDESESKALSLGLIAAGAVNIVDYNDPEQKTNRAILKSQLDCLSTNLATKPLSVIRIYDYATNAFNLSIMMQSPAAGTSAGKTDNALPKTSQVTTNLPAKSGITNEVSPEANKSSADTNLPSKDVPQIAKSSTAVAVAETINPLDELRIRMAFYRYVQDQQSILSLDQPPNEANKYRRIILTIELAATVNPLKAAGTLVYFDLYPRKADIWCHELVATDNVSWAAGLTKLEQYAFAAGSLHDFATNANMTNDTNLIATNGSVMDRNRVAARQRFLQENGLVPRIIYVEPLDEAEVMDVGFKNTSSYSGQVGAGFPIGAFTPSISIGGSHGKSSGVDFTQVDYTSLAFAAGNLRAGWLFYPPSSTSDGRISTAMKPVQRQVRMVVDVPKNLTYLTLFVHKTFLDQKYLPAKGSSFSDQLRDLNRIRGLLGVLESDYPTNPPAEKNNFQEVSQMGDTDFISRTHWSLAKSRVRSSFSYTWSDELDIELPALASPPTKPADETAK